MKHKNFLKKLTAGILGFVMTLGVGAAGYSASATETHAAKITDSTKITAGNYYIGATTGGTDYYFYVDYTNSGTGTGKTGTAVTNKSNAVILTFDVVSGGYTIKLPNEKYLYLKNAKDNGKVGISDTAQTWTASTTDKSLIRLLNNGYALQKNNSGTQFGSYGSTQTDVWLENAGSTKTVSSLAISGTMSTKTYTTDDSFDPTGLTVTATYSDSTTENVTTSADFNFNPTSPTVGLTSVGVTASYGGKTSPSFTVSGLTVTAPTLQKVTIKIADIASQKSWSNQTKYTSFTSGVLTFTASGGTNTGKYYSASPGTWRFYSSDSPKGSLSISIQSGYKIKSVTSSPTATFSIAQDKKTASFTASSNINFSEFVVEYEQDGPTHNVSIEGTTTTVYIDKTITFTAGCTASDTISWTSSAPSIATVASGVVTGVSAGKTTITASCAGGGSDSVEVEVKADSLTLKSISASGATAEFTLGDSFVTTGLVVTGTYSHANGDPDSPQTISTGITTSPSAGTKLTTQGQQSVTVNAGGKSTTYNITVNYAAVTDITATTEEIDMGPTDDLVFTASVAPENANQDYSVSASASEGVVYTLTDTGTNKGKVVIGEDTEAGTITLTFTSTGKDSGGSSKTCTTTINVKTEEIPQVVGFVATGSPTYPKQYRNSSFVLDLSGITITGTYSDSPTHTDTFTSDQFLWNTSGNHPVGTYLLNSELTVNVNLITLEDDGLGSIAFVDDCDMTNKEYWVGDSWNFTGLAIEGKYKTGGDFTLDTSKVSFTTTSTTSVASDSMSITVTAHYQGFSGTEPTKTITGIKVKAVTMTSLTVSYTGGQPVLGTDFVFAGTITANYSNGDTQPITDFSTVTIGNVNKFTLDEQTITVTHKTTGASGTFKVQYKTKTIRYQTVWTKVSSIAAGDVVTFVYEGTDAASYGYEFAKADGTLSSNYLVVTMNGSITTSSGVTILNLATDSETSQIINPYEFTVVDTSSTLSGTVAFKNAAGNYMYASNAKSSSNYLAMSEGAPSSSNQKCWNVSFSGSVPTIKTETSTTGTWRYIKYNKGSGQERFSGYVSGQEAIAVYKKTQTPIDEPSIIKLNASIVKDSQGVEKTFNEGDPITVNDFTCSTLNDLNETSPVTATSVEPTTLNSGVNEVTVHYGTWSTKVSVNAAEVAHLASIEVVENTGKRVFERGDTFTSDGLEVMAHYSNTDKTKFPDHKVTDFEITTTPDMTVLGDQNIGVSYSENGVTKTTSYTITINPKTSTWITISGEGITGSDGQYYLTSEVTNNVALTFEKDGEEETVNPSTTSSFLSFANGVLSINSSTTTSEQGDITFSAGNASAKLTVTVTAQESITLISDEEVSGFIGDEFDVQIALGNVGSAEWTLPSSTDGFTVTTTSKDNTGFVGTISVSEACANKEAVFSVLTGKGETLSVSVYITAIYDAIDSISATCSKTYVAGQDSFDKSDLTVTYERLSGATGTLTPDEFTVTGAPTGKLARTSYNLTITSVEGSKTCNCTISADMPSKLNVVTSHTEEIPGQTTVTWSKLTSKTQVSANEKVYLYADDIGYITGYSDKDGTVSKKETDRIEFTIDIVDATQGTFKLCDPTSQKYITYYSSNKFGITSSSTDSSGAIFQINADGHFECVSKDNSTKRYLCANGSNYREYTSIGSYTPFDLYISKTTPGTPSYVTTYTNHESMSGTMFDFINRWGGTELTAGKWGDIFNSDEYKALTATDKEWFKTGVVADDEGTMESCELFADFITKYDQILAMNSELVNYLDRDKLNLSAFINASIGFQFTGLEMKKFEFVFTGEWTTEEKVSSYGFMISKNLDTLNECIESKSTTGSGVTTFVPKDGEAKCSAGVKTTSADTIYYAVFFYEDANGIHYSLVLEISINGYLLSDQFDINSITDPYAKAAIQAWIASLEK